MDIIRRKAYTGVSLYVITKTIIQKNIQNNCEPKWGLRHIEVSSILLLVFLSCLLGKENIKLSIIMASMHKLSHLE